MDDLREELREILERNHQGKFSRSSHWIACKCPYCDQNSKKTHLYIHLDEKEPLVFKCFRASCGVAGVLNRTLARKLGIHSSKILDGIDDEFLKNTRSRKAEQGYYTSDKKSKLHLSEVSNLGLEYFKYRTGKELSDELQSFFRICTNMRQFYEMNKKYVSYDKVRFLINKEKKGHNIMYFFNDSFTMVYYREMKRDGIKGKTSIIDKREVLKSHKPYAFKTNGNLKLHKPKSMTLFIAEGTFDILNTYFYLAHDVTASFVASTGFAATKNIIMEFSKYHYRPYIVIASDSEISLNYYRYKLLPKIKDRISNLVILYNEGRHDMGDYSKGFSPKRITLL